MVTTLVHNLADVRRHVEHLLYSDGVCQEIYVDVELQVDLTMNPILLECRHSVHSYSNRRLIR